MDDEDAVAFGEDGGGPGGAGDDGVIKGDGDAATLGETQVAGEGGERGGSREVAGGVVYVDTHGLRIFDAKARRSAKDAKFGEGSGLCGVVEFAAGGAELEMVHLEVLGVAARRDGALAVLAPHDQPARGG